MFALLTSAADWAPYCAEQAGKFGIPPDQMSWGRGPKEYPCLVCSVLPEGTFKVYSAYVYPADAERLAAAATPKAPVAESALPNQRQFNRWISALSMTVAHVLTEKGLCTEESFEDTLLEMLEKVDHYHGEKKAALRKQLRGLQATILDGLNPLG